MNASKLTSYTCSWRILTKLFLELEVLDTLMVLCVFGSCTLYTRLSEYFCSEIIIKCSHNIHSSTASSFQPSGTRFSYFFITWKSYCTMEKSKYAFRSKESRDVFNFHIEFPAPFMEKTFIWIWVKVKKYKGTRTYYLNSLTSLFFFFIFLPNWLHFNEKDDWQHKEVLDVSYNVIMPRSHPLSLHCKREPNQHVLELIVYFNCWGEWNETNGMDHYVCLFYLSCLLNEL